MKYVCCIGLYLSVLNTAYGFGLMGYRWDITTASPNICWWPDETNNPGIPSGTFTGAIGDAADMWEDVTSSYVTFSQCGGAPSTSSPGVLIRFADTGAAGGYGGCAGMTAAGICVYGTITLSNTLPTLYPRNRLATLIAHELGHVLGIAHSDRPSIMSYHRDSDALTADDWAAVSYLYPAGGERDEYAPFPGCGTISSTTPPSSSSHAFVFMFFGFLVCLTYASQRIKQTPQRLR